MRIKYSLSYLIALTICCFITSQKLLSQNIQLSDSTFYYTVRALPQQDRTELEVSLRYKVFSDTAITVKLPQDYYGTPDIYKSVTCFIGKNNCQINGGDNVYSYIPVGKMITLKCFSKAN